MPTATVTKIKPEPLGLLVDKLEKLREKKREASAKLKLAEDEFNELEEIIKDRMTEAGVDACKGKKGSVSLTQVTVANIVDFDALCAYVNKTGYFHLFQRRISDPAFRELSEKKPVPGLEPFVKTNLNLRSVKTAA